MKSGGGWKGEIRDKIEGGKDISLSLSLTSPINSLSLFCLSLSFLDLKVLGMSWRKEMREGGRINRRAEVGGLGGVVVEWVEDVCMHACMQVDGWENHASMHVLA